MTPRLGVVLVPTLPPGGAASPRRGGRPSTSTSSGCGRTASRSPPSRRPRRPWPGRHGCTSGSGWRPVPLRNVALLRHGARDAAPALPRPPAARRSGTGCRTGWARSGARVASPLTLLREYAEALRRLLDGHEVTRLGSLRHLDAVRLDWPPEPGTPLLVGGCRPAHPRAGGSASATASSSARRSPRPSWRPPCRGAAGVGGGRGRDGARMPVAHPPHRRHRTACAEQRLDGRAGRWGHADGAPGSRRRRGRVDGRGCRAPASRRSARPAWCSSPRRTSRTSRASSSSSAGTSGLPLTRGERARGR